MRTVMLAAGSVLALAIAGPAFAQTQALSSAAPKLPNVGVPAKGLPSTPVVKPRVGHSNRPSVKARAPVLRAGPASGRTLAQVKAPLHPGDSRVARVRTTEGKALIGKGASAAVKRNGVRLSAAGHGQGVNTKKMGLPLTAANNLSAAGQASRRAGGVVAGTPAGSALGGGRNGHGVVGANLGTRPSVVNNSGGGGKKH
jgi:hypothetical protein